MMGISTQRVKLDINKQANMQVIRLGQGDKNGTTLIAELYDGGSQYSLSGKTARFTMRTPDRRSSYSVNSSSTSNNTATFNIDERYAAGVAGTTDVAYIEVLSGSTVICSTSRMRVICLQSATEGVSPSQMHDNGLDAAIAAANTAASSANTAASNANTKASRAETATTSANTARDNANTAASAANTAASAATTAAGSATTAASAANSAKDAANAAASAANTAADNANTATSEANAAIEAMGDISELAVPEMTTSVRGGAKVGGSTQVIGGKLEVKLSESATGTSVTTGSTSALRELQVHGESIQDGTPTPDAPVEVQTVKSPNFIKNSAASKTENGITFTVNDDGTVSLSGTATANTALIIALQGVNGIDWTNLIGQTVTLSGGVSSGIRLLFYADSSPAFGDSGNGVTFTVNNIANTGTTSTTSRCYIYVNANTVCDGVVIKPQLEAGSTATPYVPYGSIGIDIDDTQTPIDLQGNTLASLPDGTRDELHVDSAGRVWIEKRVGKYVVTGNETITETTQYTTYRRVLIQPSIESGKSAAQSSGICTHAPYVANTSQDSLHVCLNSITLALFAVGDSGEAVLSQYVGAVLYYALTTPVTIDLGYITPPAIPSGSVVTVSASLTPTFDLACWTEHASEIADIPDAITTLAEVIYDKQESIASSIAPVEGSTASANHAVDDYLMLGARLYRVTTAIASGERIIPGTNVTETTVMAEIVSLLS